MAPSGAGVWGEFVKSFGKALADIWFKSKQADTNDNGGVLFVVAQQHFRFNDQLNWLRLRNCVLLFRFYL